MARNSPRWECVAPIMTMTIWRLAHTSWWKQFSRDNTHLVVELGAGVRELAGQLTQLAQLEHFIGRCNTTSLCGGGGGSFKISIVDVSRRARCSKRVN